MRITYRPNNYVKPNIALDPILTMLSFGRYQTHTNEMTTLLPVITSENRD